MVSQKKIFFLVEWTITKSHKINFVTQKLRTGYAQKYFDETRKISHSFSFSQLKFYAQRLREHAQMYHDCSLLDVAYYYHTLVSGMMTMD